MRRAAPLLLALLVATTLLVTPGSASAARLPSKATWERQDAAIMKGSVGWLRDRVERAGDDERLAINLDIDNTSLATHYAKGRPVKPTLRLAKEARRLGVKVFFNTARPLDRLDAAVEQLEAAGFPVDDICGRRPGLTLVEGKQACRAGFAADGFTITANVGNRPTDFTGGGYEKKYKLRSYAGRLS
ncbi:HAD family acid phosphatase [Nocardioides marmoraquaticus]